MKYEEYRELLVRLGLTTKEVGTVGVTDIQDQTAANAPCAEDKE
jgi:hypothetical protein